MGIMFETPIFKRTAGDLKVMTKVKNLVSKLVFNKTFCASQVSTEEPPQKKALTYGEWAEEQLRLHDLKIQRGVVHYPTWELDSHKRVRLEHHFGGGITFVCLEQTQSNPVFSRIINIKLHQAEWSEFFKNVDFMRRFVKAVEDSDGNAGNNCESPAEVLQPHKIIKNCGWSSCTAAISDQIRLTFKWKEGHGAPFSLDIRRGVTKFTPGKGVHWIATQQGLSLGGNLLKLFLDHIIIKVTNGIRMWDEMRIAGVHLHESLFSTYIARPSRKGYLTRVRHDAVEDADYEMDTFLPDDRQRVVGIEL